MCTHNRGNACTSKGSTEALKHATSEHNDKSPSFQQSKEHDPVSDNAVIVRVHKHLKTMCVCVNSMATHIGK